MTSLLLALLTLFQANFQTGYEPAKCGQNISRFVAEAKASGLDMSGARILIIKNAGFSAVGLVNAEYARSSRGPQDTNWFHHVILEVDDHIFDFDFGNSPEVLTRARYFEKMFLEEGPRGWVVGKEEKLNSYVIEVEATKEKIPLRVYLK